MMNNLNEDFIFHENISDMRMLLTEATSKEDIIDAIKNKKIIWAYYTGDHVIKKGYRTIEPYAVGISTAGNVVLRAFQQAGASDTTAGLKGTMRPDHDIIPQWRLFYVSGFRDFIPTGRHFKKIRPLYKPNDKQMREIFYALQPDDGATTVTGLESPNIPDISKQKIPSDSTPKKQAELTKMQIIGLYDLARTYYKKSTKDLMVVLKNGDYVLDYETNRSKFKPEIILGNLRDLFNKYTGVEGHKLSNKWIDDQRKAFQNQIKK